jgi:hypothetical protein
MLLGIPDPRRVGFEEQVDFLWWVSGCANEMSRVEEMFVPQAFSG